MRRIQWYHFYYVKHVGKQPPRENTILEFWHYINDVIFAKSQCPVTALCKKVGGHHFGQIENKQHKTDPKLGFALLNSVYSPILHIIRHVKS